MMVAMVGWMAGAALVLLALGGGPAGAAEWGSITITPDPLGGMQVALENSKLRCRYMVTEMQGSGREAFIKELVLKASGENQAGAMLDELGLSADEGRGPIMRAEVTYVGPDRMAVRLESPARTKPTAFHGDRAVEEVTIYPDCAILKLDYVEYGVNVVDWASPGGTTRGVPVVYGMEKWIRGHVLYPDQYYSVLPEEKGDVDDAGSLNYHGSIIAGVYDPANGRGVGRVMPVADTSVMKHMGEYRGIEWFPHVEWSPPYASKGHRKPFTGYLYLVTGGAEEILEVGKKLADGQLPAAPAGEIRAKE
jgi:hypothetical protein